AAMVPNLSLVYNSQAGNGIAGQGWELSGLSMIHRCPKNRVQDGRAEPVSFSDKSGDGVCLDSQRLLKSATATNTYYLESDPFTKIGMTPGTPGSTSESPVCRAKFKVVTKSGETRTYGSEPSSQVRFGVSQGDCTAIWLLDRVQDVRDNYFDVHYN